MSWIEIGDKVRIDSDTLDSDSIWEVLEVEKLGWMGETILELKITDGTRTIYVTDECVTLVEYREDKNN